MKLFYTILILSALVLPSCALTKDSKNYPVNSDDMYLIAISSINGLNFKIVELQSSSGYILFKTPSDDEYLVMVSDTGDNGSCVKIQKVKNSSPLAEIRQVIFQTLSDNINNIPHGAETK